MLSVECLVKGSLRVVGDQLTYDRPIAVLTSLGGYHRTSSCRRRCFNGSVRRVGSGGGRKRVKLYEMRFVTETPSAGSWPNGNPGLKCMWPGWESGRVCGFKSSGVTDCGVEKATEGNWMNFWHLSAILGRVCGLVAKIVKTRFISVTGPKLRKSRIRSVAARRDRRKLGLIKARSLHY